MVMTLRRGWYCLLLPLLLALAGCSTNTTPGATITISGTIKVSDGTVPPVANLVVLDSNNNQDSSTGTTGIATDTGAYSVTVPGPGVYKFDITATNAVGRSLSKTTGNETITGSTTLNITISAAAASAATTTSDTFDIGQGNESLQPT